MPRATRRDLEVHGQLIPAGKLVLPMIGSANRDPMQFPDAGRFDIARARTRTSRSGTASTPARARRWHPWRPGSPSPTS